MAQLVRAEDAEAHEREDEHGQLEDDAHREEDHRHEPVVVTRAQLDVELLLVVVRQVVDGSGQRDEVAEDDAGGEECAREEHEPAHAARLALVHRRREERPELPQDHRRREDERAEEADLHDGEERLGDAERRRPRHVLRQRPVQPVEEAPVEGVGDDEPDEQRAEADEDPLA